jgi:hypothetical protein
MFQTVKIQSFFQAFVNRYYTHVPAYTPIRERCKSILTETIREQLETGNKLSIFQALIAVLLKV